MAISMNVLAVALSGIFNESLRDTKLSVNSTTIYSPALNGVPNIMASSSVLYPVTYFDHFYATLANLRGNASLPPWVDDNFFYLPFALPNSERASEQQLPIDGYSALTRGFGVDLQCEQLSQEEGDKAFVFRQKNNGSSTELSIVHKLAGGGNVTCIPTLSTDRELLTGKWTNDASALEIMAPMELSNDTGSSLSDNGYCSSVIIAGWVRIGPSSSLTTQTRTSTDGADGRTLETAFMQCQSIFRTALFNVTVDKTERIMVSERQGGFDTDLRPYGTQGAITSLIGQISSMVGPSTAYDNEWHNDTTAIDWINSLLKIKLNSSALVDPAKPVPNIPATIPHFTDIYQRLAAVIFAFNMNIFEESPANSRIPVIIHAKETRIFMEPTMFYIAISILALQLFTLVAYYVKRPRRFLPRLPLTIASIIAYVSASQAAQDYSDQSSGKSPETRYGYGRFKGADGRTHVGIEKEPLVIPLKSKNPEATRRKWRFGRSLPPEEPRIWI
jgi:hypothetical protein